MDRYCECHGVGNGAYCSGCGGRFPYKSWNGQPTRIAKDRKGWPISVDSFVATLLWGWLPSIIVIAWTFTSGPYDQTYQNHAASVFSTLCGIVTWVACWALTYWLERRKCASR